MIGEPAWPGPSLKDIPNLFPGWWRCRSRQRQPGALTAGINYYRANVFKSLFRGGVETPKEGDERIRVPTLFIYGEQDQAVLPETVRGINRFIDAPYSELRIPGSAHWVQNEAVAEVN